MDANNYYVFTVRVCRIGTKIKYEGSDIKKDVVDIVKKAMDYIEMEYPWYFTEDEARRNLAFVKGGKGYYSYFSTISKKLSAEDYKKAFEKKLTEFFKEALEFIDEDVRCNVLESGHSYGSRECLWNICLPGNDNEIIIEFNSQRDQDDIPWHTLSVVSEEEEE